ncbi:uncharacterized protein [Triticum aestivum]|uniref:uncharacterized protein n=1 Tax=Triticum aestivum TaxID=4565 RepID=UPI001D02EA65|nr:uncharacterized protein LOC123090103 [Triticum aestivum]
MTASITMNLKSFGEIGPIPSIPLRSPSIHVSPNPRGHTQGTQGTRRRQREKVPRRRIFTAPPPPERRRPPPPVLPEQFAVSMAILLLSYLALPRILACSSLSSWPHMASSLSVSSNCRTGCVVVAKQ